MSPATTNTHDNNDVENTCKLETKCINSIRCLGAALPNLAKSGHPGAPMGCAPMAHVLYSQIMKYDPADPKFLGRDRFVLSLGHGCALLYSMMHLTTDHMTMQDLKEFRSIGSKTPGHPEVHATPGVEVTTGPLGLGLSQAVGLAMGQHSFYEKYGELFNTFTYCMVGDGCLQEGVSSEASSFAGTQKLGRLICLYDSNKITIDGATDLSFTEDVEMRYKSYGFQVITVEHGDSNPKAISDAINEAKSDLTRPSMIIVKTTIGYGSSNQGTAKVHGAPIGDAELQRVMGEFGLGSDPLALEQDVLQFYNSVKDKQRAYVKEWNAKFANLPAALKDEINDRLSVKFEGEKLEKMKKCMPVYGKQSKDNSTRNLSGEVLNAILPNCPTLIGGSADLTGSNMTALKGESDYSPSDRTGKYIRFGVREFAMQAITNGLFAHGGFTPFCATFLNFITFSFPAVRLAALSNFGTFFVASHDSIELGEDGPTHQPVEVLALLRATPNLYTFRPCDGTETVATYLYYLQNMDRPVVGCFSRGAVPQQDTTSVEGCLKGAYPLETIGSGSRKVVISSSGTEVRVALAAAEILSKRDCTVTIVSTPCWDLFMEQSREYREATFPKDSLCVSVEAMGMQGKEGYLLREASTTMETFGGSAPAKDLFEHFGFTGEKVSQKILDELER